MDELFRSDNLVVRREAGLSDGCCVVTFDSFTDDRSLDRAGFGEAFLRSRGIDGIHVVPRENDWYQYPEMAAAMACIHAATRGYARVVTYGSSMGAYAAIRFAGLAGAHCALALSPQFSIDPAVARFERRWLEASARFRPLWEGRLAFPALDEAYVAYDPADLDRKHLALLAQEFRFTPMRLPGAGHPVTGYLAEVGLLEAMVLAACRGRLDVEDFVRQAWERRGQSSQHYAVLASRTFRLSRRIALLKEAVRIAPGNAEVRSRLGRQLGRAGRFEEAMAAHQAALAIEPGHPNLLMHYSRTLERSGDIAGALAVMEEVAVRTGQAWQYMPRLRELRARVGRGGPVSRMLALSWRRRGRRLAAHKAGDEAGR